MLTMLNACRRSISFDSPGDDALRRRFFLAQPGSFDAVMPATDFLKQADQLHPFALSTARNIGWPVWNKVLLLQNRNVASRSNSADTSLLFIPLVPADSSRVNGVLIFASIAGNNFYKIIPADAYAQYGYTNSATPNAHAMALLFMQLEYQVLGRRRFYILDKLLLPPSEGLVGQQRIFTITPANSCSNCAFAAPAAHAPCFNGDMWNNTGSPNTAYTYGIDGCYNFLPPVTGGNATAWGTGWQQGGGNPPAGNPPPAPPGWTALVDDGPCDERVLALQTDTAFIAKMQYLNSAAVTGLDYEKGFLANNLTQRDYFAVQGIPGTPDIDIVLNQPIDGIMHSHLITGAPMFSRKDVLSLANFFFNNKALDPAHFFIAMTSRYGDPYLLKVADPVKFRKFAERMQGKDGKEKFLQKYKDKFNSYNVTDNEIAFLEMLNSEMKGGLALYRGSGDCRQWSKLKLIPGINTQYEVEETDCK
jgi:hypothetical protein